MITEVLYREELVALKDGLELQIKQIDPTDELAMIGAGGLAMKLERMIKTAPPLPSGCVLRVSS